jgi:magnesium chelatase subunit I
MEQERARFPNERSVKVPDYMREVIAELTFLARRSSDINQRSGVSVRVSIANYETLISNALRRSIRQGEETVSPRVTDLPFLVASFSGKVELETFEEGREARIMEDLAKRAVLNVFNRRINPDDMEELVYHFEGGAAIETSSTLPSAHYANVAQEVDALKGAVEKLDSGDSPETIASAIEFILEGLHLNRRLNCERSDSGLIYGARG